MGSPLVSVIFWCHSRQEHIDITIPKWLEQVDVDYEVVVLHGPGMKFPSNPRLRTILSPIGVNGAYLSGLCKAYNTLLKEAKGDIILTTQADIEINSPTQIRRMVDLCTPNQLVSDRIIKDDVRDPGIYCYCLMGYKSAFESVGGWCELYDAPDSIAHEDADLVASMLENGHSLRIITTPDDEAPRHIRHPRPDYYSEPFKSRVAKGYQTFKSRHKDNLMTIYAKMFAKNMMRNRRLINV
jgi:glycosyltransferase involved in cell wall biosynthesis